MNMHVQRTGDASELRPTDLTKLQIAQTLRDYHHRALWEEEKHFTWIISILLASELALISGRTSGLASALQPTLATVLSLLGVGFSAIALRVIRREGEFFRDASERFVTQYAKCFSDVELPPAPATANKPILRIVLDAFRGRIGIRDAFQLVFCLFFVVFLFLAAASMIYGHHVHPANPPMQPTGSADG